MRIYSVSMFYEEETDTLYTANKREAHSAALALYKDSVPCSVYVFDYALRPAKQQILAALNGHTDEYRKGVKLYDYNPWSDDDSELEPPRF